MPTEAELARADGRDYEPASVLLERILAERRQRWEEGELARMKAAGKTPKYDTWKAKYKEPAAPHTAALPLLRDGWCWATVAQVLSERLVNGRSVKDCGTGYSGSQIDIATGRPHRSERVQDWCLECVRSRAIYHSQE